MPTDAATASSSSAGEQAAVRGSPDDRESSSSPPSSSPHSPAAAPSFPFGRPQRAFSPSAGAPAIKQMEMMTRNYSDFMRSLAAKYNNANGPAAAAARDNFPMAPSNGLVRGFDTAFSYKSGLPFVVRNLELEGNGASPNNRMVDSQTSPTSLDSRGCSGAKTLPGVGMVPCGLPDFSSSQTLLNLVRTASAQSASQLENYLRGAVKRNAESENVLDPLDLTMGAVKKPKLEGGDLRDGRDFSTEGMAGADGCRTFPAKPSWMSLLDKRMHPSPTSSTRTSPKIPRCVSLCTDKSCSSQSEASDLTRFTVEDVFKFVSSVETCSEYAEKFREQWIDGSTLPLLTEDHLMAHMGFKLGPALKLRSTVAKKIGHCAVCMHCLHCHADERHESSRSPSVSK